MKQVTKLSIALAAGMTLATQAVAADYPARTIEIIVPFNPGGGTDLTGRLLAEELKTTFGSDVIVRNVNGASGTIGTSQVAAAKPDGHTLGIAPIGPLTTQPHLRNLPYDNTSFEYVCQIAHSPVVLMTNTDSGISSVDDLIEKAKAEPGALAYGSAGPGSIPHVASLALVNSLGIDVKHVPQDGMANTVQNVVQVLSDNLAVSARSGLPPIAAYSEERLEKLPDVPTFKELGHDVPSFGIWWGVVTTAGTPPEVVKALSDACGQAMQSDAFVEKMTASNIPLLFKDHEAFTAFVEQQYNTNGSLLEQAGLKK
ncbi:Bug family tripartite tricarboxylate transporter substrate binding protein [Ruegeria jejuensis]|uniref:Bug family tripartite tricarboxylate transporter substrate binding protein n=1 Tax=Ruegeria jejuensis TaxID=3233338 RepID=UPI00355AE0DF